MKQARSTKLSLFIFCLITLFLIPFSNAEDATLKPPKNDPTKLILPYGPPTSTDPTLPIVTLIKLDGQTGQPVVGAQFALYDTDGTVLAEATSYTDGCVVLRPPKTVSLQKNYVLRETAPADGYQSAGDAYWLVHFAQVPLPIGGITGYVEPGNAAAEALLSIPQAVLTKNAIAQLFLQHDVPLSLLLQDESLRFVQNTAETVPEKTETEKTNPQTGDNFPAGGLAALLALTGALWMRCKGGK